MRKRNRLVGRPQTEDAVLDMSPMIDMVFQLIIFFMVTAQLITLKKDPDVKVAIAPKGQVGKSVLGKILINVYSDEQMKKKAYNSPFADMNGKELAFDEITELVRKEREKNEAANIRPTILMLRGDRSSLVRRTKEALAAAGAAGVNDIVFSALQKDVK